MRPIALAWFDLNYARTQLYAVSYNSFAGSAISRFACSSGTLDNTISGETSYEYGIVTGPANVYPPAYSPSSCDC